jgi:hypothetical protein
MDCLFIHKNLFAIVENTLSPVERSEMDLHVKSCPDCLRVISGFRETIGIINGDKSKEINPFIGTRILHRIESVLSRRAENKPRAILNSLQPVAFAASLFLAVLIGFSLGKTGINRIPKSKSADPDLNSVRSELFISDITDEDKTLFLNP